MVELGGVNDILFHLTEPSTQYLQHESVAALSILSEDGTVRSQILVGEPHHWPLSSSSSSSSIVTVCSLLNDHGIKFCEMLTSSEAAAAQPSFLVSLLHIIKRLCQTDGNQSGLLYICGSIGSQSDTSHLSVLVSHQPTFANKP